MTKQEVCTKVFMALLDEELLNEADAYDITNLQIDVECVISRVLEDYTLVYTTGIINE